METNGNGAISPKTRQAFVVAVENSSGQLKRGLLDYLDFQEEVLLKDPSLAAVHGRIQKTLGWMKRRIHNDVSTQRDQILACFEIYENGGIIPAFGRTQEARDASAARGGRS